MILKNMQVNMNKFLYIATDTISISNPSGVCKKIISQCEVFSSINETYLINYSGKYSFINGKVQEIRQMPQFAKFRRYYLFKEITKFTNGSAYNVYIRYPYSDPLFLFLLSWLKILGCKTIIEIPTYPYTKNHDSNLYSYIRLLTDKVFSVFLRFFVDRIVTYSDDKKIFGIQTINTINGVDFSRINLVNRRNKLYDVINLVGIAHLYSCHGYDRIIKGLAIYNNEKPKTKVKFSIVGNGPEYENLLNLIQKYNVEESVKLLGFQTGESLDKIYDDSDIAVNSLAIHRIGLYTESTLKAKEYCAKGLPIISSYEVDSLSPDDNTKYVYRVPLDDSPITINRIVDFYNRIRDNRNLNEDIRNKSICICDMPVTLKPVIDYFTGYSYTDR